MKEITELLRAFSNGDEEAMNKLMPLVEKELKKIARSYMHNERRGHILQTTALVNEALIKLIRANINYKNRKQFYAIVADRMHQVLIEYARAQLAAKRGKRAPHVDLIEAKDQIVENSQELLNLEEALIQLAKLHKRKAQAIEYHFFIGLTVREIAELFEVDDSTVQRDLRFARTWLKRYMTEAETDAA